MRSVTVVLGGLVQGVGFRWWTEHAADRLGLVGHVRNLADGSVEARLQGAADRVDDMVAQLTSPTRGGRPGRVTGYTINVGTVDPSLETFEVTR